MQSMVLCLKPDDSEDPEHWNHYDPDDFYDATSQEIYIFTALGNMKHVLIECLFNHCKAAYINQFSNI